MNGSRFLTFSIILTTIFLFTKIYQHNRMVKLMYEKQRIERKKEKLIKKKNSLLVQLYKLKNQKLVRSRAEKELGMKVLKPSQIVTLTCRSQGGIC